MFLATYRAGTLSGAARALGVDQSTASRRLGQLEAQVGAALFARSRAGVHPTPVAEAWRPIAERAEAAVREAQVVAASSGTEVEGEVRLALPDAIADYLVAPALPELTERYGGLRLRLDTRPEVADLARLEADLAVRFVRPEGGDLTFRRLGATGFRAYATADYLRARAGVAPDKLDWISFLQPNLPEPRWLAARLGVGPRVACNRATTIVAACRAGAGVALLPERFARHLDDLVELPLPGLEPMTFDVWLARPAVNRHLPHVEAVAAWLAGIFEQLG